MGRAMTTARVKLWGRVIGAVTWLEDRQIGVFEYEPAFVASNIEIAPLTMRLASGTFSFPALPPETFKGLPGLLADTLPDKFGNRLIDAWLASQGRAASSFNPIERLCYVGTRGMGALEFEPALTPGSARDRSVDISKLVGLANQVLDERTALAGVFDGVNDARAIDDILRVGTSAGGARAKAIIAWNPQTGAFRSGQIEAGDGFSYWLMKFDGVSANKDKELADPQGFGRIEYAYHLMAKAAGIEMMECRLHEEGGRAHFMTRRFDRTDVGGKLHMLSLCAMRHWDFNAAGAYSYEQAIETIRLLGLPRADLEQQVRRAIFNILARNQDDHVKNIAFLMDQSGAWRLSPAFDIAYAWNPDGSWTHRHQMSLNGKRDGFAREDLFTFARFAGFKLKPAEALIDDVTKALSQWHKFGAQAEMDAADIFRIERAFRDVGG
jgi:serine/threonine-protein kinase HipA